GFQALFDTTGTYKACDNQVAKPHCAACMRTTASRLLGELPLQVLGFAKGRGCAALRHIVIHDGSAFAIHDGCRAGSPGRFTVFKPAAVALHPTMALLCDAPTTVVLTPDTTHAPALLPAPVSRPERLLLADRGYLDLPYLHRVQDAGGCLIIRA